MVEALGASDVFLCPSVIDRDGLEEGVPVAVLEAMAAGLPVVGSRLDGIAELVEDGVTGWLTSPRGVEEVAARLCDLAAEPDRRVEMGTRGRERVQREFDIERLNDRLVDLYARVARQP